MADEQDFSKPKYTISKNENGRDVIQIQNDIPEIKTEDMDDKQIQRFNLERMEQVRAKLDELHLQKRRNEILIFCFCVLALVVGVLIHNLRHFDDYDVKNKYELSKSSEAKYIDYQNNLLRYSKDGAFYTEYNGNLIWNYTYEMSNPTLDVCGNYILIYDKKGTQVSILTNTGFKQTIKTAMPIMDANISEQGTVAILMQSEGTGYVELCDEEGKVLVSGELHMENNGYPIAIALSDSGQNLMVSQLDLNKNDIKTTISFYNFGRGGKDKIDNIVATYSFSDQIIPEVTFLKNGKAVAFGDSELVLFHNNTKATIDKEIFVDGEIKSIYYDDEYFGTVCGTTNKNGEYIHQLSMYNDAGRRKYCKNVDSSYNEVELLSNHEVYMTNRQDAAIYSKHGIKKFTYTFDNAIYKMIPGDGSRRYYFVTDNQIQDVRMK